MCDAQCAVAADDDQGVQFESANGFHDFIGNIYDHFFAIADDFAGIGVAAAGRAEDRPAARQDAAYILQPQSSDTALRQEAVVSISNSKHFTVMVKYGGLDRRPNHGVQSRRSEEHTSELQSPTNLVC